MKKRAAALFMAAAVFITSMSTGSVFMVDAAEITERNGKEKYEIYPVPQAEAYTGDTFALTSEINLVTEPDIDEATLARTEKAFADSGFSVNKSEQAVEHKTNVLLGTYDSGAYVDQYADTNLTYAEENFSNSEIFDPYVLSASDGNIIILGKDSNAVYYGAATLDLILDQITDRSMQEVQYDDYAHTQIRGFIEGFYGDPWTHEGRMSLMEFGGNFKSNAYIYAPKDEPYHNSKWRIPYPEEELDKIKELVVTGNTSKCTFIWAIHPGFGGAGNKIDLDNAANYQSELNVLLDKYEQLYEAGVRQFALCMDDVGGPGSDTFKIQARVNLITDVANWALEKGDVGELLYVPEEYQGAGTSDYIRALSAVPENVKIMWTGSSTIGACQESAFTGVNASTGRKACMWLNWPVNDYCDDRVALGKGQLLKPGTHNISGVVANPMNQSELSKVGIFAALDFTWNVDDFADETSWLASFDYILEDETEADALRTIARHSQYTNTSYYNNINLEESENIKDELAACLESFRAGEMIDPAVSEKLVAEFRKVADAAQTMLNCSNGKMAKEGEVWFKNMYYLMLGCKSTVESAVRLQNKEISEAINQYMEAAANMEKADLEMNYVPADAPWGSPYYIAIMGSKYIRPFEKELLSAVSTSLMNSLGVKPGKPAAGQMKPIYKFADRTDIDLSNMMDGDENTNVYIQTGQKAGDFYGYDFGEERIITGVRLLQGINDGHHDIFHDAVLECSSDNVNWTEMKSVSNDCTIELSDVSYEARFIRLRLKSEGFGVKPDYWTGIREFTVHTSNLAPEVYTTIEGLEGTEAVQEGMNVTLTDINNVTFEEGAAIWLDFFEIRSLKNISADVNNDRIKVQVSLNGVEWADVPADGSATARYIRLVNTGEEAEVTIKLLAATIDAFEKPQVTASIAQIMEGSLNNLYDGDLSSAATFGTQNAGDSIQVDIGGIATISKVALVIGENEQQVLKSGKVELSEDGNTWTRIGTIQGENGEEAFPVHVAPLRFLQMSDLNQKARYLRISVTGSAAEPFTLNEIQITSDLLVDEAESYMTDGKLDTAYTIQNADKKYSYALSAPKQYKQLAIIQSQGVVSDAVVTVRTTDGEVDLGKLREVYNGWNLPEGKELLEIKLSWRGAAAPAIAELILLEDATLPSLSPGMMEYTITAKATEGGTAEGTKTVAEGSDVTLTAKADSGYNFAGWFVDGKQVSSELVITVENVIKDAVYEARFEKIPVVLKEYTITAKAAAGGKASGTATVKEGSSVTLKAEADHGYTFAGWYLNGTKASGSPVYTIVNVRTNAVYEARFTKKPVEKLQAPSIKSVQAAPAAKGVAVKITVNRVNDADRYEIYRVVKNKAVKIGTTKSGKNIFSDTKLNSRNAKYYAVAVSKDGKRTSGKGKAKSIALAKATKLKKPAVVKNGIQINWVKAKKAKQYVIYRSEKKATGYKRIAAIKKPAVTSYIDKKAKARKTYYYKIVVKEKKQASLMSKAVKAKR